MAIYVDADAAEVPAEAGLHEVAGLGAEGFAGNAERCLNGGWRGGRRIG